MYSKHVYTISNIVCYIGEIFNKETVENCKFPHYYIYLEPFPLKTAKITFMLQILSTKKHCVVELALLVGCVCS